ncbi:hypothetical protein N7532_010392 [Penicillium argentinense]|uniref:DDE-1 domain-containing protein n=1 Tax=Penicillium argentinense TaxID=1131581 RepID=A0A9W9JY35_9EURO|nr:uncharacterized protein N7532_010392 [Penicillium argentinense]KAJ5085621.1 hypothetical protein N7532_010392 [Penicillium argentinense]
MPRTNREIEELIEKALEKLHTQSRLNISKVAREFDVPYQRLRSPYRGKKSLFEREPRRKLVSGDHTNCEYVTVVEAISTDGFCVPPLIIVTAAQLQFRWFDDLKNEHIAITETGYINDQLAYQWIQHFEKATRERMKGSWRMLICDGFGSHLTYEMVKYCEDKKILLFFLPPHTSHLLQPLDLVSSAIESATATGCTRFSKIDFLAAISSIRTKTFTLRTIHLGFKLSGIWPINPNIV